MSRHGGVGAAWGGGFYLLLRGSRLSWDRPTPKLEQQREHSQRLLTPPKSHTEPPETPRSLVDPPPSPYMGSDPPTPPTPPAWGPQSFPHPGGSREDGLRKRRGGAELVLQDAGRHDLRRGHGGHALQSLILRDLVLGGGDRGETGVTKSPKQAGTPPPSPQARFAKQGIGGECPKYPPQNTAMIINARVPPVRDPPGP